LRFQSLACIMQRAYFFRNLSSGETPASVIHLLNFISLGCSLLLKFVSTSKRLQLTVFWSFRQTSITHPCSRLSHFCTTMRLLKWTKHFRHFYSKLGSGGFVGSTFCFGPGDPSLLPRSCATLCFFLHRSRIATFNKAGP